MPVRSRRGTEGLEKPRNEFDDEGDQKILERRAWEPTATFGGSVFPAPPRPICLHAIRDSELVTFTTQQVMTRDDDDEDAYKASQSGVS